jgi:WD40 repeat protein
LQCWDLTDGWKEVGRWQASRNLGWPTVDPVSGRVAIPIDSELHLLDGRTLRPWRPPAALVGFRAAFSPGGRTLALTRDKSLALTEADSGSFLRPLMVPDGETADTVEITDLAFSPDGAHLVTASEWSRHVKLWDVVRGRLLADLVAGNGGSMRVAFRPGGRTLVVAADHKAVLYEVTGADIGSPVAPQSYPLAAADVSPDGRALACLALVDPTVTAEVSCWPAGPEAPNRPHVRIETNYPGNRNRPVVALRPGGGMVYVTGDALEYWPGVASDRPERLPITELKDARFGPDGRLWVAAGHEVSAYELPGWRRVALWASGPEDRKFGRVFYTVAPGSGGVLVGRRDGRVFRLDAAGNLRATWSVGTAPVTALTLHERADLAVAGDEEGRVRIFRLGSGEVAADLPEAHRDAVEAAALSPDGRLVATGGRDRAVRLWRPDGTAVLTLPAMGPVTMLAFGPGGEELFALVSGERGVRRSRLDRLAERLRELGIDPGY